MQELRQRPRRNAAQTGLLPLASSAAFLTQSRLTCPRMALPKVVPPVSINDQENVLGAGGIGWRDRSLAVLPGHTD